MDTTWKQQRLAKVTSSKFADVITEPRSKKDKEAGELSSTAKAYLNQIIAEYFYDYDQFDNEVSMDDYYGYVNSSKPLEYGNANEPHAIKLYEKLHNCKVKESEFINYKGDINEFIGWVGGTPDGYLEDGSPIEIKSPWNPANHIGNIFEPENYGLKTYQAQIQGHIWLTGADKCTFISYDGRMSNSKLWLAVHEVKRDDEFIESKLIPGIQRFLNHLKPMLKKLNSLKHATNS